MPAELVARLRRAGCVWAEDEAALLVSVALDADHLEHLVERRIAGEPLEIIVGWVEFAGLRLGVGPGVFVPRRRTELLARVACEAATGRARVLDLCCGVGAVAAAVAAARPDVEVFAADLDPTALTWARHNLRGLRADAVFEGDLYAALPADLQRSFTVIAANAPYVPTQQIALMPAEARDHEPRHTLDGGGDGTALHARIAAGAGDWLVPGGVVIIETGAEQSATTSGILASYGFQTAVVSDDELDATVVIGRWGWPGVGASTS